VPVGQALDVVVEVRDRGLPQRGELGVDGFDVRLAQGVAGQIDLPKRARPRLLVLLLGTRLGAIEGKALATGS